MPSLNGQEDLHAVLEQWIAGETFALEETDEVVSSGVHPAGQRLLNVRDRAEAMQPTVDLRRQIFRDPSGRPAPMPWHAPGNVTAMPWAMNFSKRGGLEENLLLIMLAIALRQAG